MTTEQLREKIIEGINELNANPSFETLANVESMIDSYSDWYKDDYGFRPRSDIGYFRSLYNEEAKKVAEEFEKLDWDTQLSYLYPKN